MRKNLICFENHSFAIQTRNVKNLFMKNIAPITSIFLAAALLLLPTQLFAADCASQAQSLAAKEGAELLNVADLGNDKCEVTLRIPGKNGQPPRVVSKRTKG
jgi:hypothetical protein